MNIVTVCIDLAMNVFSLHGIDQSGKAVFIKSKVARDHQPIKFRRYFCICFISCNV
jgi:hypothetical protein